MTPAPIPTIADELAAWVLHANRRPFVPVGALAALNLEGGARALAVLVDRIAAADGLLVLPERGPGHAALLRADAVLDLLDFLHEHRAHRIVEHALALAERTACIRPH